MEPKENVAVAAHGRSKLSPAKLDLLRMRLSGRGADTAAQASVARRPEGENPLSFGQERILFQLLLEPDSTLFHIPLLVRFEGALDAQALEASLNAMIERHEILRSSFAKQEAGLWKQTIAPKARLELHHIDLRHWPTAAQEAELAALVASEARNPFDLSEAPLMRAELAALAADRHALLLTIHHIVWDGWSSVLMIREIRELYKAFVAGEASPLEPLPVQYADFAHWQRRLVESEAGHRQIAYWKRHLAGLPQFSALPTDRPRGATQRRRGGRHSWSLAPGAPARLSEVARRANTTLFVALLSSFYAFLFQLTGQADFAIGTTIAYRTRQELEKLVGFFTNVLVLRANMAGAPSFETLLSRVHEVAIDAQAHQDAPFERIVEELAPKRDLSHNPLFQIAFVLHNLPAERLELPGVALTVAETDAEAAAFDLVLHIFEEPDRLKARFEYDADLFDRETMALLASNFDAFLENLLEDPTRPINCVSLLSKAEEMRALAAAKAVLESSPQTPILHRLVGAEAKDDAIAVVCGAERLGYGELAARSNRLAHRLIGLGVGPDAPVGVFVEPSVDMIVAILGVLKAGGAYVPVDPSFPGSRIGFMMADCKPAGFVSTRASAKALPSLAAPLVLIDDDETLGQMPTEAPASGVKPDNLAYVIYTSGSTGQPKGVMVSHRNAVASTRARGQYYREPVSAFLLLSSIAFDSSVAGLFSTLADGGTLCVPEDSARRDPQALARLIERHAVSHLLALPSLYFALLELSAFGRCSSLRCAIVAGEECRAEVVQRHFQTLPRVPLHNEYGPSETTVWAAAEGLRSTPGAQGVSIGLPIPGAEIYCVGPNGNLAPAGTRGELWIGGEGVARGYLGRPDLTAERFVPNPFAGGGARLFRTGDIGRVADDGRIEFLGRVDDQVKIRGYRVEPREVEAALARDGAVAEAAVVARKDRQGGMRLLAFVATTAESASLESDLKARLGRGLPDYMVPERVVTVASLPRLPNGKIDRAALPALEAEAPRAETGRALDEIELLFAEIWQDVLGVDRVEATDNFFDIGGTSLSAIQVVARIQQLFEEEIPVTIVFDAATLAEFSREVVRIAGDKGPPDDRYDALLTGGQHV